MKPSALLIAALALAASVESQANGASSGAAPAGMPASLSGSGAPDIAGIRVGISANEARQQVQKLNPKYKITPIVPFGSNVEAGFQAAAGAGRGDRNGADFFSVLVNEAGIVWLIKREQTLTPDKAVLKDTLIQSLTAKYDQPGGVVKYRDPGNINLAWSYDMSGRQLASYGTNVNDSPCRPVPYASRRNFSEAVSAYEKYAPTCSMTIDTHTQAANTRTPNMIDIYAVTITAPPLQHDAGALNAAAAARQQQQKAKENTIRENKPQL